MDDASAHVHRPCDRSLSHSRLVQSQHLLIACIALVSTDLLLALSIDQASKLHLLSHLSIRQFRLTLALGLIIARSRRCVWRGAACSEAALSFQRTGGASIVGRDGFERTILNLW